jgi:hypothetical protein
MSSQPVTRIESKELAAETAVFTAYLQQLGLPIDNIIASTAERGVIAINLPTLLDGLPAEEKRDARYLSKFVGATAIGLFDAALNYVWNEVVLNLQKKASLYGIELFFDAAVGGKTRDLYKDEKDLSGLKDCVLLDTCRKLELVSDIVYRKLDHILTMRNEVAASHPNVERIGGYELLGWLQTCMKDVLQDRPSESAIQIKSFVDNLKSRTDAIDDNTANRLSNELKNLSLPHLHNLLITIFGIFVSADTSQVLRLNVAKIAPAVWKHASDQMKFKIGIQLDTYRTNLNQEKQTRGQEFLRIVDGLNYESIPAKVVALDGIVDQLLAAHQGWDNFYNEPPFITDILRYCKTARDIPKESLPKIAKTILRCRLGRGLTYNKGVSPGGKPKYDQFFKMLDDDGIAYCLTYLFDPTINGKLTNGICQEHLLAILTTMRGIVISDRLRSAIDLLMANISIAWQANNWAEFRELTAPFIAWS